MENIIKLFYSNVKGAIFEKKTKHDGEEGHFLESLFNIKRNSSPFPDIYGYELKKSSLNKITFGDWSADYYIFKNDSRIPTKRIFLEIFGCKSSKKEGRYS